MTIDLDMDLSESNRADEAYFDDTPQAPSGSFDARLLHVRLTTLATRTPVVFRESDSATDAMREMQKQHRGCALVTEDGTMRSRLRGIFTERDVLLRIIDRGRHPSTIPLSEVMTAEPESLDDDARLAWALNLMSVGGFRHVPVTDTRGWPVAVVSVRDVVEFLVEAFPNEILNLPPDFGRRKDHPRDGA